MSKRDNGNTGEYDIGFGKPPERTQFKKGQSGNPKGRPKKTALTAADVTGILDEPITVTSNGRVRNMSAFEAGIRQLARSAIKEKNLKSIKEFLAVCEEYDVIKAAVAQTGGGVLFAPRGVDFEEWAKQFPKADDPSRPCDDDDEQ